jgi:hypothetical protein
MAVYGAGETLMSATEALQRDRGRKIMSDMSSEGNGDSSFEGDWREALSAADQVAEELALEVARIARARLVDVEVMLRDFWYDSIDHTPLVAARISVAARLVHKAVETLGTDTML